MLKIYQHETCSTCRNARTWLESHGIPHEVTSIRKSPPSAAELAAAMKATGKPLKSMINTSGMDYRALGLKDKLPTMPEAEVLDLLASNGMLVKRPFAIDPAGGIYLHGFREKDWSDALIGSLK